MNNAQRQTEIAKSIMTNAWEGGIAYWMNGEDIRNIERQRDEDQNVVLIKFEWEGKRNVWTKHEVTPEAIKKMVRKIKDMNQKEHIVKMVQGIVFNDDFDCDSDAGDADVIVQLTAFGEIVYS